MKAAAKNNHHHCDGRLLFLSDAFHRRNHQSCLPGGEEKKKISSSSFPFLTAFGAFDEEKNENEIGDERRNSPFSTEESEEEEMKGKMSSSTSPLWATEAEFAKDAKEMERLKMMLKRTVDEAKKKKKKTKKKTKKGIDVDGKMATISTVKVMLKGERVFSRHAMKSFERIESRDGNIERAFGERRLRKLYGRVVKSEKKKGTTMVEVHIDRVQVYSDADEESDVVVVGCVDASSTGLGVNFEDTPEFRNEVRLRVDANDVIEGVHHPFAFIQLDSLVSSFGSECRFECYDARNDFEPLDFEIV